jgi:hypothetical protein
VTVLVDLEVFDISVAAQAGTLMDEADTGSLGSLQTTRVVRRHAPAALPLREEGADTMVVPALPR